MYSSNQALENFLFANNNGRGIQNGGSVTFTNKFIEVFKRDELVLSFSSDVTVANNIASGDYFLIIENRDKIKSVIDKMYFWSTKYIITYEQFLIIENKEIKIIIS